MILPENLLNLIRQGEGLTVEFKKSSTDITKDVYDTVCSFSNREGGHIFFGVKDNSTIIGVDKDCLENMKKNFVTTINNESKIYPPLYLTPEEYEVDGCIVLYVYVPIGKTVIAMQGGFLIAAMSLTSISQIMRTWFSTFMPVNKAPIL